MSTSPMEQFVGHLRQKPMLPGALIVIATLLLYCRVAHYEVLIFDDKPHVTQNVHVNTGLNPSNAVWSFTAFHEGNRHPITWLSHVADCQWFGLKPGPLHLVNVALQAVNVLPLFRLLRRASRATGRIFFVAAPFAVYPLNVGTVAWRRCKSLRVTTWECDCRARH